MVKHLSGELFDHEAVCLSSPTDIDHPRFLGAPELDPPTGESTATVTINVFNAWSIDINSLCAAVWDTTAIISGVDHGACACIKKEKGIDLLWCACRHHISEVDISHVFTAIRGPTTGNVSN